VEDVQVVAAHPAQHLGPAGVDVGAQGVRQGAYVLADFAAAACGLGVGSEVNQGAIAVQALAPSTLCTMLP
jgi:hypothetical protein